MIHYNQTLAPEREREGTGARELESAKDEREAGEAELFSCVFFFFSLSP